MVNTSKNSETDDVFPVARTRPSKARREDPSSQVSNMAIELGLAVLTTETDAA